MVVTEVLSLQYSKFEAAEAVWVVVTEALVLSEVKAFRNTMVSSRSKHWLSEESRRRRLIRRKSSMVAEGLSHLLVALVALLDEVEVAPPAASSQLTASEAEAAEGVVLA